MKIRIPPQLQPSALLWADDFCRSAQDLKEACRQYDRTGDLSVLENTHQKARKLLADGQENECAIILVCLADRYRQAGRLGDAHECAEQAEQSFCCYPEIRHQHNHAAALYSLGLAYEALGSDSQAADYYDAAIAEFAGARVHWIQHGRAVWRRHCETAIQLLEALRARPMRTPSQEQAMNPTRVGVPILSRIRAGIPSLAGQEFREWFPVSAAPKTQVDYALRVRGDSMIEAGISDGDLAFIKGTEAEPPNGQIVAVLVDQPGEEATLKKFYREKDHVRLEPANDSHSYLILKPRRVSEERLRAHYKQKEPNRKLEFYSGVEPRIVGWYAYRIPKDLAEPKTQVFE